MKREPDRSRGSIDVVNLARQRTNRIPPVGGRVTAEVFIEATHVAYSSHMPLKAVPVALLFAVLSAAPNQMPPTPASVTDQVRSIIAASGAEVAVVYRPLNVDPSNGAAQILINDTTRFHAASTMKVPIMIELFRQVDAGRLRLDDTMIVTNTFTSIVDGSAYQLSTSEDSDGEIYKAIGRPLSYRQLCEAMITASSNLAANLLIERLGAKAVQQTVDALGAPGMQVLRGVEDQKAFDAGMNNTTDAEGLATLMWKIARGEVVSREASASMVEILKRQKFREGIPSGVPAGTVTASKTGSITRIRHDAAIVFAPRPYVLVVLVRGLDDGDKADALIASISRAIFPLSLK
jgi:beta-lactamase class A